VIIDELSMTHDHPEYQVDTLIDEMLWPGHPLSRDIGGTKETVFNINHETLKAHIEKYYSPLNTVISVAGNIDHNKILQQINKLTSDWHGSNPPNYIPYSRNQYTSKSKIEFRRTEQAYLSLALPAISIFHDDRDALGLLNVAIGEGMSSRLFTELRENRGLAYDINSSLIHFQDCGAFIVRAGVEPKKIYDATALILEQLQDIKYGIKLDEFNKAKQMAAGRLMLSMENTKYVASWFGIQEILLNEIIAPQTAIYKLNSVTEEDVNRISKSVLDFAHLNVAVVGPCRGAKRLERIIRD
jgi:predicted Zn-dependent peptidase